MDWIPTTVTIFVIAITGGLIKLAIWIGGMDRFRSSVEETLVTMQGNIATMQGDIVTMQGNIATMQGNIATMQGDIVTSRATS